MLPPQLSAERFNSYPPEAKRVAMTNLALLRQLPLAFVPLLLRELIAYDWKFPAERAELNRQLHYLGSLQKVELVNWMAPFVKLTLTSELEQFDWVNDPATFSERFTAHLWSTHQIDAFHTAAIEYMNELTAATPVDLPAIPRQTIVIVGQGVQENTYPLFRKLRPRGVFYTQVKPDGGNRHVLDAVVARAKGHPIPFAHWYVDGGAPEPVTCADLTCLSYKSLDPIRTKLLGTIEAGMRSGNGSEALRTKLARIRPEDLGLSSTGSSAVLDKFGISLLTEGSGTQIFSTTFVQWTAREALRRAQPLTLLARFAPRRHEQSMSEILSLKNQTIRYDAAGSLVDADIGAYYTWINEQRLPGADKSSFLVWFEGHTQALAIAPSLPRGKEHREQIDLQQILSTLS